MPGTTSPEHPQQNFSEKIFWPLLLLIGAVGIWARFHELAWHFTHADDIGVAKYLLEARSFGQKLITIPQNYTYAPLQFFITAFLINAKQTYREMLFWGRLPSCILGSLGIFAMFLFYKFYERSQKALLGLALAALSWPAILNAKQMHNYALGVSAAAALLAVLAYYLKEKKFTLPRMLALGAVAALLGHAHYQILFFLPAFYSTLFAAAVMNRTESGNKIPFLLKNFAVSAVLCCVLLFPLWHFFLSKNANLPLNPWSCGEAGQYCFKSGTGLAFFARNFFEIFQTNTAFIKETHPLFMIVSGLLFVFFLLGCFSYARRTNENGPYLGTFLGITLVVWAALVMKEKIPFGPTRHNLILLPIMAVTAAEGAGWLQQKIKIKGLIAGFSVLALGLFVFQAPQIFRERHDPFTEERFKTWLEQYKPDALIYADATIQTGIMPVIRRYYDFTEEGFFVDGLVHGKKVKSDTLAWVSHRQPLTETQYERVRGSLNRYIFISNVLRVRRSEAPLDFLSHGSSEYEGERVLEIPSATEIEFSSHTKNGSNGLYFYILKKK